MRLWKMFLIIGVVLSVIGCILLPISQIRREILIGEPIRYRIRIVEEPTTYMTILLPPDVHPYSWLLLPATIIVAIGIASIIYGYLVKRTYG